MLYRIAIFSKYSDTSIYRYVSHITIHIQGHPWYTTDNIHVFQERLNYVVRLSLT